MLGQQLGWRAAFVGVGVLGVVTLVALLRWTPALAVDAGTSVRLSLIHI